ncbi:MAG TPA: BMC domain-containing protein [Candidatus Pelethocola excrementipullorum]|nr:BMC domain-containing protein [Candidatus Pelethocola excrementipullorum]
MMKALGMIEVYGRTGAIEGLDVALKSANVSLINMCRVGGGLTAFFIEGDVGAVRASIDAAAAASEKFGRLVSSHVIPRPDENVRALISSVAEAADNGKLKEAEVEKPSVNTMADSKSVGNSLNTIEDEVITEAQKDVDSPQKKEDKNDDLWKKSVEELRVMARKIPNIGMTRKEINFAKKDVIIKAIIKTRTQEKEEEK